MLKTYCLPKVQTFRQAVGMCQNEPILHRALFDEEQREFYDAQTDAEVADALADMIFVWCGALLDINKPIYRDDEWFWSYVQEQAQIACIDLRGAFDLVHASNMSKVFHREEVGNAAQHFIDMGVVVYFRHAGDSMYAAYSAWDQTVDDKEYPAHKLMKPHTYAEPDWSKEEVWRL